MEKLLDINPETVLKKAVPLGCAPTRDAPRQARANSSLLRNNFTSSQLRTSNPTDDEAF